MSASVPTPTFNSGPIVITGAHTIAELLDRTFRALRARFGVLVLSAAMITVPLGVVTALVSGRFMTGYSDLLQFTLTEPDNAELAAEQFFGDVFGYFGAIILLTILSLVGTTLVSLMSMHHIQRFLHGESSTVAEGWNVAIRRILPMIAMQLLQFIAIGIATAVIAVVVGIVLFVVALVMGGAMAGLGNETASIILGIGLIIVFILGYLLLLIVMLAPTLLFMGRWLAAAPSLVIEGLGPITALQRSWTLTKGRIWRSLLYIFLLTILGFIVVGLPVSIAQWTAMILVPTQITLITILATIASYLLNLFYQPFYATGLVLYYYDLRVRNEAYDVTLRVSALEAELTPNAPPA